MIVHGLVELIKVAELQELRVVPRIQQQRGRGGGCLRLLFHLGLELLSIVKDDLASEVSQLDNAVRKDVVNAVLVGYDALLVLTEKLLKIHDSDRVLEAYRVAIQQALDGAHLRIGSLLRLDAAIGRTCNVRTSCRETHVKILLKHALRCLWQRDALLMHELTERKHVLPLISAGASFDEACVV